MKVLIIGIVASGKTTLARRLSKETNIKNYEIDLRYYYAKIEYIELDYFELKHFNLNTSDIEINI